MRAWVFKLLCKVFGGPTSGYVKPVSTPGPPMRGNKPQTPGEAVIDAVCIAKALDRAIPSGDGTIWVWNANAPEQIEGALAATGWEIKWVGKPEETDDDKN